jgi:hypothetical protein
MFRIAVGAALALVAVPATAAGYRLQIVPGQGEMLKGRAGLHALDIRTAGTLLRVIAPGNRIDRRGTVRVLVMNLGKPAYLFGPDEVSVELADGTALPEVPVRTFDKAEKFVGQEVRRSKAVRRHIDGSLTAVAEASGVGLTAQELSGVAPMASTVQGDSLQLLDIENREPGMKLLDGLDGVLRPYPIGPKEAWGGYLVFDLPKALRRGDADQPVTIVVKTGDEVHRIKAMLRRI